MPLATTSKEFHPVYDTPLLSYQPWHRDEKEDYYGAVGWLNGIKKLQAHGNKYSSNYGWHKNHGRVTVFIVKSYTTACLACRCDKRSTRIQTCWCDNIGIVSLMFLGFQLRVLYHCTMCTRHPDLVFSHQKNHKSAQSPYKRFLCVEMRRDKSHWAHSFSQAS